MIKEKEAISRTITAIRLPMIFAVILLHCKMGGVVINGKALIDYSQYHLIMITDQLFPNEICSMAVPLFFYISGYLFFKSRDYTIDLYKKKMKKKLKTLLVPYIFWNLAVVGEQFLAYLFFPNMISGNNKLLTDIDFENLWNIFWNYKDGSPICYQFWFIRDLMVVMIFTPVIYKLIRVLGVYFIIILGALWLFDVLPYVPGLSLMSFFFFSFGVYFRLNNINPCFLKGKQIFMVGLAYLFMVILSTISYFYGVNYQYLIHNLEILIGLSFVFSLVFYIINKYDYIPNSLLSNSSFFVFSYHGIIIALVLKLFLKTVPFNNYSLLLVYFLSATIVTMLGVGLYYILAHYFPKFTSLITGGRIYMVTKNNYR